MLHQFTEAYASDQDRNDSLRSFRDQFIFPVVGGRTSIYFTGNSLGLQPVKAKELILKELEDWAKYGVEGHTEARKPWLPYHEFFSRAFSRIVGSKETEVVAMNGLTTNLHLLMVSFFRPQGKRTKIICEAKAFPSDQYALKSQLRFHGLDPETNLIEIQPDPETELIDEAQVYQAIEEHGDELALLMMGGVNYYTGQYFDIAGITRAVRAAGAIAGWDLAHAAGNVPLKLHDWNVDFAAWCGYKYLNSGPGGVSGVFVHERHHGQKDIPRFEGWWGHDKSSRFTMPDEFVPIPTAEAWQLSNAPVFSMTPLLASLELFEKAGMEALREKAVKLTAYLEFIIQEVANQTQVNLKILTPAEPEKRGCQLSLVVPENGKRVFETISAKGVIADWREPDVIRMAPVPLYNSYRDVYDFGLILKEALTA
ncbi:MAG: kynureninase [Owenweeksia sp.]